MTYTTACGRIRRKAVRTAAAAAAFVLFLTGCMGSSEKENEYTVISDGTEASVSDTVSQSSASETEDKYKNVSNRVLYIPDNMVTKYISLDFSKEMQEAYDDVVKTMINFEKKSFVPKNISNEDYVRVLETVRCEQLMLFYLQNRYSGDFNAGADAYEMNFIYKYSIKEVNIMLMETEEAAKDIVSGIDSGMSDYEKLKYFHDYLVLNCKSSTDDAYADSIYGALVRKKALCEGFAKAFSYLCNIAEIENMIVTGYTDVPHMWNMVKLGGSWYHVDVGWDKPSEALTERYPDMVLYQYFLTSDPVIENTRIIGNIQGEPPVADSDEYSYFSYENKYAESYDQVLEIIEDSCRKCIDAGDKYFMLKLDTSNLYLQTASDLIKPDSDGVSDIDRIVDSLNFRGKISYIDYYNQYRIIIFVLEY